MPLPTIADRYYLHPFFAGELSKTEDEENSPTEQDEDEENSPTEQDEDEENSPTEQDEESELVGKEASGKLF